MNALTKAETTSLSMMSESELLEVLESSLYPGANHQSIKMVLGYCKAAGLDPMRKPVHIVPMWDGKAKRMRDVTMPGIGLYRTDAARTGEHVGTDEPIFGPMTEYELSGTKVTVPEWCKVTVYRLVGGLKCAYTATEYWIENYATAGKDTTAPNTMWKKRGRGQLAKCAEAQALRKGFPEVGNQPTADEMEGKTLDMGVVEEAQTGSKAREKAEIIVWPDDALSKRFPKYSEYLAAGKTHDEIIAFAEQKGQLTDAQKQRIRELQPTPDAAPDKQADVTEATPKVTYAAVAEKLHAAKNTEELDDAATLIGAVSDPQQRTELTSIYEKRATELSKEA